MTRYRITGNCGIGDQLCLIGAARIASERRCELIGLPYLPIVLYKYHDDGFVRYDTGQPCIDINPRKWHRGPYAEQCRNYVGTYLAAIGEIVTGRPQLELPYFAPEPVRILMQPFSGKAQNPPLPYLQAIIDRVKATTGEKVYAIGNRPPTGLAGLELDLLGDNVPLLMSYIQSARLVLSPRSLSAHVAAGYKVPSVIWCPDDGENWHLDYGLWPCRRVLFRDGKSVVSAAIRAMLSEDKR
jgi:hypothetical protein